MADLFGRAARDGAHPCQVVRPILSAHFRRPELVGRLQLIAPFFPLDAAEAAEERSARSAA